MIDKEIKDFKDEKFGDGFICIRSDVKCDICGKITLCMGVDTSRGEYEIIYICKDCVNDAFKDILPELLEELEKKNNEN